MRYPTRPGNLDPTGRKELCPGGIASPRPGRRFNPDCCLAAENIAWAWLRRAPGCGGNRYRSCRFRVPRRAGFDRACVVELSGLLVTAPAGDAIVVTQPVTRSIGQPVPACLPSPGVIRTKTNFTPKIARVVHHAGVAGHDPCWRNMTIATIRAHSAGCRLMVRRLTGFRIGNISLHGMAGGAELVAADGKCGLAVF